MKMSYPDTLERAVASPFKEDKLFTKTANIYLKEDLFYNDVRPVANLLKLMGVLPLQRIGTENRFRILSLQMLYSMGVYVAMFVLLWIVHGHELQSQHYDDSILALYHMVLMLLLVAIPFTNWKDSPSVAKLLSSWLDFQVDFCNVTGQVLMFNLKKRSLILSVTMPCGSVLLELCYQLLDVSINAVNLITDVYLLTLRLLLAVMWHLYCLALAKAGDEVLDKMKQKLKTVVVPTNEIIKYRTLWFNLGKLTKQTGTSLCYTYGFFILYMFMKMTLNIYWTLNSLLFVPNKLFIVVYILISIAIDITIMFLFCNDAQLVERKVYDAFVNTLMDYKLSTSNSILNDEIDVFLYTINTTQPVLNLGDYVTVNRSLVISLGSIMVTYLVVLLQFKLSNMSPEGHNSTTVSQNLTPSEALLTEAN